MQQTPTRDANPYESPREYQTPQESEPSTPPRSALTAFVVHVAKLIGFVFAGLLIVFVGVMGLTMYVYRDFNDMRSTPFERVPRQFDAAADEPRDNQAGDGGVVE